MPWGGIALMADQNPNLSLKTGTECPSFFTKPEPCSLDLLCMYICTYVSMYGYVQYFRLQVRMQGRWSALPYHAETTWLGRRLLETRQAIFFVFFFGPIGSESGRPLAPNRVWFIWVIFFFSKNNMYDIIITISLVASGLLSRVYQTVVMKYMKSTSWTDWYTPFRKPGVSIGMRERGWSMDFRIL